MDDGLKLKHKQMGIELEDEAYTEIPKLEDDSSEEEEDVKKLFETSVAYLVMNNQLNKESLTQLLQIFKERQKKFNNKCEMKLKSIRHEIMDVERRIEVKKMYNISPTTSNNDNNNTTTTTITTLDNSTLINNNDINSSTSSFNIDHYNSQLRKINNSKYKDFMQFKEKRFHCSTPNSTNNCKKSYLDIISLRNHLNDAKCPNGQYYKQLEEENKRTRN